MRSMSTQYATASCCKMQKSREKRSLGGQICSKLQRLSGTLKELRFFLIYHLFLLAHFNRQRMLINTYSQTCN